MNHFFFRTSKINILCSCVCGFFSSSFFDVIFVSQLFPGFMLSNMATRFLLGYAPIFSKVLLFPGKCMWLHILLHKIVELNMKICYAAMNTPFLYHDKITALLVGKIPGLIEAQIILVLLQWNLRGSHAWILLEVVALIIHLLLCILLKHTRTCRKGFRFSRKVWHA